jgi:hypothetical protein
MSDRNSFALTNPPRPRLVLRFGVTGHRPGANLLASEMERIRSDIAGPLAGVSEALAAAHLRHRDVFSDEAPLLVAVSALAEGSDRLFAKEALGAGWPLEVVLPSKREDYEQDFATSESKTEFRDLLDRARAIFELDGPAAGPDRSAAYETAGTVMLDHCDLIAAIWDGREGAGRGGTREIVDGALRRDIPVIWINSVSAEPLSLWDGSAAHRLPLDPKDSEIDVSLAHLVSRLVSPPAADEKRQSKPHARLLRFLHESERASWPASAYDMLLGLFARIPMRRSRSMRDRHDEWQGFLQALPRMGLLDEALTDVLLIRFLWADQVAHKFGRLYRSAYVLNFIFAAFAVGVGALTVLDGWNEIFGNIAAAKTVSVAIEFGLIATIVGLTFAGRRAAWHERFLDARRLAEVLRQERLMAVVGLAGRGLRFDRGGEDAGESWTTWYARATLRELPLPRVLVDADFLGRTVRATLDHEVKPQLRYHRQNHQHLEIVHHRLDRAGEGLFYAAVGSCLLWFAIVGIYGIEGANHEHWIVHTLKSVLTFLGAALPAFAAALAGIRAQGDFGLLAKRSTMTEHDLRSLVANAEMRMPVRYGDVCAFLQAAADTMTAHLGAWRFTYRHRPLTVPG